MESRYSKSFFIVVLLSFSLGIPLTAFANLNEEFKQSLQKLRSRSISKGNFKELGALEAQCLNLVKDHNSPPEKSMIYATIALIYSSKGYRLSDEGKAKIAKTIEYGKKATAHSIADVLISCKVHGRLSDAIIIKAKQGPKDKFAEARREAIIPCLKGLKIALDNNAPKERPELPPQIPVPNDIGPDKEARRKRIEEYKKQFTERKQLYEHLRVLYNERRALANRCVTIYSGEPYDPQEFRNYAQKILVGYEDVINELVEQIEKRNAEHERRKAGSSGSQVPKSTK